MKLPDQRPRWYDNPYCYAIIKVVVIGGLLGALIVYSIVRM
jgi:hypothetical protein